MRNPLRLKNLGRRYWPWYAIGLAVLVFSRPTTAAFAAGVALVVLGAGLRTWGAGHLVKNDELTISGPYARVRHPLYVGTLLVGVGFGVIVGGALSLAILPVLMLWFFVSYFPRKEKSEAARLRAVHGAAFDDYRAGVPALVPRLSAWTPTPAARGDADATWSFDRYSDNNELGTLLGLIACLVAFGLRAWGVL
jgi:protein-S-isoprenylcysteine O-methyltransferase Ste14